MGLNVDLAKPGHGTTYLDLKKKNVIEYNIGILLALLSHIIVIVRSIVIVSRD